MERSEPRCSELSASNVVATLVENGRRQHVRDVTAYISVLSTQDALSFFNDYLTPCAVQLPTVFLLECTRETRHLCDEVCSCCHLIVVSFDGVAGFGADRSVSAVIDYVGTSLARQSFVRRSVNAPCTAPKTSVASVLESSVRGNVKVLDFSSVSASLSAEEAARAFLVTKDADSCVCVMQRSSSNLYAMAHAHSHIVFKAPDRATRDATTIAHAIILFEKRVIVIQDGNDACSDQAVLDLIGKGRG
tara:strand:+ start:1588 stop:2328 length:741 start_codon:yes stop_codon:yes gene_type:complete